MKLTTNFQLQELVHPLLYLKLGDRVADWLNPVLPITCQELRDEFGPIIVNDWLWELPTPQWVVPSSWNDCYTDSGLRLPHSSTHTAYSSHKGGCAADLKFRDADPEKVQHYILQNQEAYPYITRMEDAALTFVEGAEWLHIEVGMRRGDIIVFKP